MTLQEKAADSTEKSTQSFLFWLCAYGNRGVMAGPWQSLWVSLQQGVEQRCLEV